MLALASDTIASYPAAPGLIRYRHTLGVAGSGELSTRLSSPAYAPLGAVAGVYFSGKKLALH